MHITINVSDFRDAFHRKGRKDSFSYQALGKLFEYLQENYPDSELDVVELCCEYSEYDDLADYNDQNVTEYANKSEIEGFICSVGVDGFIAQNL
jgi:hypothetical protein